MIKKKKKSIQFEQLQPTECSLLFYCFVERELPLCSLPAKHLHPLVPFKGIQVQLVDFRHIAACPALGIKHPFKKKKKSLKRIKFNNTLIICLSQKYFTALQRINILI